jgi:hypothetical protein
MKTDNQYMKLLKENQKLKIDILLSYKEGFNDGIKACKPNKKLDEAIKKGVKIK